MELTVTPIATTICAWRGGCRVGKRLQFTVEYLSAGDGSTRPRIIEVADDEEFPEDYRACVVESRKFPTFALAAEFAATMPGPSGPNAAGIRLTLGGLGVAHSTSRAGFPKRGPDVLSDDERAELTRYGFDVSAIAKAE